MAFTTHCATAWLVLTAAAGLLAQKGPDDALRALQDGNRRFVAGKSVPQPLGEGVRRTLARGQSPFAIVLCCADSRVPPEHLFNAGLGELFVVRIAGNTCDAETLASIEYAVEHLNVPLCVVLGHESCGAVAAAVAQSSALEKARPEAAESQAIAQLLEQIEPAVRKTAPRDLLGKDLTDACEEENVHLTVHECIRRSPLLRRYAQVGKFQIVPARYHLDSGEVEWLPARALPPEPKADTHTHRGAVPMTVPPHVALRLLQAGHRRFLGDGLPSGDLTPARRTQLTTGQQPVAIVLTCADSRTAPEHVFDAGLGELFVIRVAGNAVNDDVLASIEYAAHHTGASLLVVMGHTRCGAVTAAAEHPEDQQLTSNMRSLLARLEPSVEKARASGGKGAELVELAVRANVLRAIAEARSRSAILRDLEKQGRFAMLPVVYDIASGDLTWLKDAEGAEKETVPAAAPSGETAHDHGSEAHDENAAHGAPGDGHEGKQGKAHTNGAEQHLSVLDWGDRPETEVVAAQPHAAAKAHATEKPHQPHAAASVAEAGPADSHDAHSESGHDAGEALPAPTAWNDPIVLVGISGVASLLLAALVAMMKRG